MRESVFSPCPSAPRTQGGYLIPFTLGLGLIVLLAVNLSLSPHYSGIPTEPEYPFLNGLIKRSHMMSDWLFLQLYALGENPYDFAAHLRNSILVGVDGYHSLGRFNPPWYYLFIAPLSSLSPSWFVLFSFGLTVLAAIRLFELSFFLVDRFKPHSAFLMVAIVLFPPLVVDLAAGQVSVFLALAMVSALLAESQKKELMVGFWLALLSVKPQSTYLVCISILVITVRDRRYRVPIAYLSTLTVMIGATYLAHPDMFDFWVTMKLPTDSKTFTLATYVRQGLLVITNKLYDWPIIGISAFTAFLTIGILLRKRISVTTWLLLVPGISAMTAPYGWFYDSTIIAPLHVYLLCAAWRSYTSGFKTPLIAIVGLALFTFIATACFDYLSLWFYPVLLTGLTWFIQRKERLAS